MMGYFLGTQVEPHFQTLFKFPAHLSAIRPILPNPTVAQFLEAINQGFELEWSANDSLCDTCKSSGGLCGYNKTTTAFTCYSADQPQDFECSASPQAPSQSTSMSSFLLDTMSE